MKLEHIETYYFTWLEDGKDWFAACGNSEPLFEKMLDLDIIPKNEKQNVYWLSFWLPPQQAESLRKSFPSMLIQKPDMNIEFRDKLEASRTKQTDAEIAETAQVDWKAIEDVSINLKTVITDAEKELATSFANAGIVFTTPLTKKAQRESVNNAPRPVERPAGNPMFTEPQRVDLSQKIRDRLAQKGMLKK